MSWIGRVVDSILSWGMQHVTLKSRLRCAYRRRLEVARLEAAELIMVAERDGEAIREKAVLELGPLIANEYAKVRHEAKVSVEKEMAYARSRLDSELAAARKSFLQERDAAIREAQQQARETALLLAYNEAAMALNIATVHSVEQIRSNQRVAVDVNACYPNIYDTGSAWVVRVLTGDVRHVQVFDYDNKVTKIQRLIDAVSCRNALAESELSQHAAVYEECLLAARQTYGDGPQLHVRAAEQFHVRLLEAGERVDSFRFVGTDPEDRLQIADHVILREPVAVLVNDNRRVLEAFARIGIDRRRTVRDLLLLTGDELLEASGFGEASLRRLRVGLAEYGLALWGDPTPTAPPPPRQPGDRSLRSIEFE